MTTTHLSESSGQLAPRSTSLMFRAARGRRDVQIAFGLVVAGAFGSLALWGLGQTSPIVFAPLLLSGGLLLVLSAVFRFEAFVLTLIASRAAVDSLGGLGSIQVNAVLSLLFVVFGLIWIASSIRQGTPRTPTTLPAIALVLAGALSVVASTQPGPTAIELLRVSSGLLMLEVLQRLVTSRAMLNRLLAAFLVSSVVPIGVGLYQVATDGGIWVSGFVRIVGTFRHPNPFSIYLVLILLTLLALMPNVTRRVRVPLALLSIPATICLVASLTRSAWIALALGVVVLGILQSRWLIPLLAAVGVVAILVNPNVLSRFSDLSGPSTTSVGDPNNSFVWRMEYWGETLSLAEGRPVTGIGLGMVQRTADEEKAPHNDYLRIVVESGVLGLLAYFWLIAALIQIAVRAVRKRHSLRGPPRGVAVGFVACLGAILVLSAVSNVVSQVVLVWYIAVVTGMAGAATTYLQDKPGNLANQQPTAARS